MTILSVSIHSKLDSGIRKVADLSAQLRDETNDTLTDDQRADIQAMMAGVTQFQTEMLTFPDFSTQTPQQLSTLRHDLRNHLNLISGFAYVFVRGLGGEMSDEKLQIAGQIHQLSKGLISIVNRIA